MLLIFFESFVSILRGRFLILLQQTLTVLTIVTFRFWMAHYCRVDIGRSEINAHIRLFRYMRTPVKHHTLKVNRARKAGRSPQNWLFGRRLVHQMIITEVCCYFLISSTKKQRYIFCKNQTDKAHFRLRMVSHCLRSNPQWTFLTLVRLVTEKQT